MEHEEWNIQMEHARVVVNNKYLYLYRRKLCFITSHRVVDQII